MTPDQMQATLDSLTRSGVPVTEHMADHLTRHAADVAEIEVVHGVIYTYEYAYRPASNCDACQGRGHVAEVDGYGERTGRATVCPVCGGAAGNADDGLSVAALWDKKGREDALRTVRDYTNRILQDGPSDWLTLVGEVGTGKTTMAKAILADCRRAGMAGTYAVVPEVLDELRRAVSNDWDDAAILSRYDSTQVAVFDQLDWVKATPYALEKLRVLFNRRYESRGQQATICVVNREIWNERGGEFEIIIDRMREGYVADTKIPSMREALGKRKQGR